MNSKQINNYLEITADIQLIHLQLWPSLSQIFIQIAVSCVYERMIIEIVEKYFSCWGKSKLEIAEQRQSTDYSDCLLQIWSGDLIILSLHLFGDFDLFEVWHSEEHAFFPFPHGFEVEKIVIFHFIVGRVGHSVVDYQVLYLLYWFAVGVTVLDFGSSFMVKVDDCHTEHRLIELVKSLIILIHYLL